jgi:hypothetical protein
MRVILPVALFALAGVLTGGAVSLYRQGAGRFAVVLTGLLAVLALAGGLLWLGPGGD